MDGRISRRGRWAVLGLIAGFVVAGMVGTAAWSVASMTPPDAVQPIGKPGQLIVLKMHPLLPALVVDTKPVRVASRR